MMHPTELEGKLALMASAIETKRSKWWAGVTKARRAGSPPSKTSLDSLARVVQWKYDHMVVRADLLTHFDGVDKPAMTPLSEVILDEIEAPRGTETESGQIYHALLKVQELQDELLIKAGKEADETHDDLLKLRAQARAGCKLLATVPRFRDAVAEADIIDRLEWRAVLAMAGDEREERVAERLMECVEVKKEKNKKKLKQAGKWRRVVMELM